MSNTPNIRFKGFTDDWEQRKLGDILEERSERASGDEELLSVTIGNGVIRQVDSDKRNIASEDKSNYKVVKKGDIPYNSMRMWQGAVGNSEYDGIVSPAYTVLTPTVDANGKFFMELFKKKSSLQIFQRWSQGLTSDTWNLKYPILSSIQFNIPSIEEQNEIAEYFSNLDNLITLHQRKCDETKKLKKYMLQKMFPKKGETKPEIRFAGFTDDWEQRKLGDITELKSASRVHKKEWTTSGVPFYRSSDVMSAINGTKNEKAFISEELYEKLSDVSGKLEAGDVLVTGGGSVGNPYIVPNNEPLYTKDADLLWIKNQGKFYPYFLYEFFFSPTFRNYLASISHVGTIAHYTITQLSETPICLPNFEEQKKVGEYFQSLDHLITLHQRKCDEMKEIKKFMLQNMFPKKG